VDLYSALCYETCDALFTLVEIKPLLALQRCFTFKKHLKTYLF